MDVTLGEGAGLAVLHHIRALAPNVTVFALTTADRLALGMQAAALGSAGTLVMPLSGDELLNALSDVRTRMAERVDRLRLERIAAASKRHAALVEQVAEIAESATRREAADRLAEVLVFRRWCAFRGRLRAGSRRIPTADARRGVGRRRRCAQLLRRNGAPEPRTTAGPRDLRLALRREQSGLVLLGKTADGDDAASIFPAATPDRRAGHDCTSR